jgi:hypothetical protein
MCYTNKILGGFMKNLLALALFCSIFTGTAKSMEINSLENVATSLNYAGGYTIVFLYNSIIPGLPLAYATTTGVDLVVASETSSQRHKVAQLLQNDVQDYYQAGKISESLEAAIVTVKNNNQNLSESESVDQLNDLAFTILNERE